MGVNQLEGEIPLFITNASKLEIPILNNNFLTGTVPTNLGNLCELQSLFLHTNQLTNEPREHESRFFNSLMDCRTLRYVEMDDNPLNGVLPNYIGNLSSTIENFYISNALINGLIPPGIGNMSSLTELNFEGNNLAGSIPSEIGKLKQLQGLFLTYNKLQRHITEAVCHLSNLVKLTLAGNNLTGEIPECIGNLSMLQLLSLFSNRLSSEHPLSIWKMSGLLYLDMSQNCIEGEFPSDIGELKAIIKLDFSSNHFLGMLPSKLGELQNLQYLDLSNNSFFGQIPLSFANLISLEFLHLSLNSLSGTIPKSMGRLSYLKSINVSFNELEGEIPSGGVFVNSTVQSFLGNKGLCGVHILEVPACTNPGLQSKSKELVRKVVIPVVISFFLIFLLASIWIVKRQKKGKSKDVEKVPDIRTHQLVSYHKIQRATNYFDESNLIDVGSSGSVYKGTLSSGIVVAIKILDLEYEEVCKRFDGECEVMRNVRHRNLVPVITTCSSDYIRAFVLQYMSNGSLENWLYREDSQLNLLQ
ncbi:LRR receptor-like serine/threonine-protein kinase EFR [Capsicum annuum]|uniref:LRR receptor-like serine/threonine-protein kinase EFR n=1 Tax=Capsicum annuum TaxID=4072 RepID=UPI001FB1830D|nr:LRR receptor-like serine/threonine-protein kinase EFR [Capsicum annuum]